MTTKSTIITRTALLCGTAGAAAAAILLAGAMLTATPRPAEAFPAYAQKTGFVCGVCHNNAKGGGPLSPYGIKWVTGGMKAHPAPPPKPKK